MRAYFDTANIDDEMLRDCVSEEHIRRSSAYIEDVAESMGVAPERIIRPTPFKIERLAEAYALMETAKKQSMMNTNSSVEGADAYELKRRVYAAEVERLEGQITADTFTGGLSARRRAFPMSVPLYRR